MKKIIIIGVTILLLTFLGISMITSKSRYKSNEDLITLYKPYINNVVMEIDGDKYYFRIKDAKVNRNIDLDKSVEFDTQVTYSFYKNEVNENNFIKDDYIWMSTQKEGGVFGFKTNFRSFGTIFYAQLFFDFTNYYTSTLGNPKFGSGSVNESDLQVNPNGEIIEPGEVIYDEIHFGDNFSVKYNTTSFIESFDSLNVFNIKYDKVEGDYNPLWTIDDNEAEISLIYFDDYKKSKKITDRDIISKFIEIVKEMPFTFTEKLYDIEEPNYYILLEDSNISMIIIDRYIQVSPFGAICEGEEFVREILELLE